jgi:hypothetical protein
MNTKNIKLWNKISTKTTLFHKNFDMIVSNDNIISEYDGQIGLLRLSEKKQPLRIGEFTLSIWNLAIADLQEVNLTDLIDKYKEEDTYYEFNKMVSDTNYDYSKFKKIVFLHSLIIKPEYRKCGVTEEFIEFIYRNFYDDNTVIFALVKPIQENYINSVFYSNEKKISFAIYDESNVVEYKSMSAFEYYSLENEYEKTDAELNQYKLFSVAKRCGFKRVGDGYLFEYNPFVTIKRLVDKQVEIKNLENGKN